MKFFIYFYFLAYSKYNLNNLNLEILPEEHVFIISFPTISFYLHNLIDKKNNFYGSVAHLKMNNKQNVSIEKKSSILDTISHLKKNYY